MTDREPPITYSLAEAARILDVPTAAVREAVARGMIRATILGKVIRVPADEVERLLVNSARHAEDPGKK
jgi:excisionase family DNA binding protein